MSQTYPSHLTLVDGGFDGEPFLRWVMEACRWIVQVVLRPKGEQRVCSIAHVVGGRVHLWLAPALSPLGARLRMAARNLRNLDLLCCDPYYGQAVSVNCYYSQLLNHPLNADPLGSYLSGRSF